MHATTNSSDSTTRYYAVELDDGTTPFTTGIKSMTGKWTVDHLEAGSYFNNDEVVVRFDQCAYDETDDIDPDATYVLHERGAAVGVRFRINPRSKRQKNKDRCKNKANK